MRKRLFSPFGNFLLLFRFVPALVAMLFVSARSYPWAIRHDDATAAGSAPELVASRDHRRPQCNFMAMKLAMIFALFGLSQSAIATQPSFDRVANIIAEKCLDCHNAQAKEGTVNLERFKSLSDVDRERSLWKTIFDVVEAGQMPLTQSGYELDIAQRDELLSFARMALSRPDSQLKAINPGKPILRHLTRLEYNNTVRDLFGLDYDIFMFPERLPIANKAYFTRGGDFQSPLAGQASDQNDSEKDLAIESRRHVGAVQTSMREYGQKYDVLLPDLGLPGDNRAENGFTNRGDAMNFAPLLFEKHLEMAAAIASSERLLRDSRVLQDLLGIEAETAKQPAENSDSETVVLRSEFAARDQIGAQAAGNDTWHDSFASELTAAFERGSGGTFDIPQALNNQKIAGKGGLLKIRMHDQVLLINPNIDLWLASFATVDETSGDHSLTNRNKGEKVFELTFSGQGTFDPQIQHLGVCVLARRSQSGRVQLTAVFSNGKKMTRQADVSEKSGNVFFSWVAPPGTSITKLAVDGSEFTGDYVLLDDFGFIFKNQFSAAISKPTIEKSVADKTLDRKQVATEDRIAQFLSRAYRRRVTEPELASAKVLFDKRIALGDSESQALRRLTQSVLTSPELLFLSEPFVAPADGVREVTAFELGNRLSYFLWASMPDDELLKAAESEELKKPEVLREQVRRMLADRSRSRELSESFAVQWLRLDQLYSSKPDREIFKAFYSGPLGKSTLHGPMMTEALLLFETVLVEDRTILDLYDPDFTWLNGQLAQLYGLQDAFRKAKEEATKNGHLPDELSEKDAGSYWLRTRLPDRTRGGVMTMAGPLTLTSLPFRTSPIKRGAWLLETVFNRPPSEPKVAFVLEEASKDNSSDDSRKTVRQRFEKHRSDPNCYSCHSRIDPPGFSLEAFDAMGVYRTHDGEQPVDASGSWNDRDFTSPTEFKDAIRAGEYELVRGFIEHLLSYALARRLEHFDMRAVDQIVTEAADDGFRISAIIESIVLSYPFQYVRNQP